jgi:hypothetical protein
VKVAAMIDALRAAGMTGSLGPKDRAALLAVDHDPQEVAALYAAIYRGEYPPSGDPYLKDNLAIWLCLDKLPGWLSHRDGYRAPAKPNGKPPSGQEYLMRQLALERQHKEEQQRGAAGPRRLPGGPVQAGHHAR